jgi:hypothetical protein
MVAAITGAWVVGSGLRRHSTDSAEAAGASRSWRLEKRAAGCKNGPADSLRAMRASLDTLSGLHNHEP